MELRCKLKIYTGFEQSNIMELDLSIVFNPSKFLAGTEIFHDSNVLMSVKTLLKGTIGKKVK